MRALVGSEGSTGRSPAQVSDVANCVPRREWFEIPRSHHVRVYGAGDIHRCAVMEEGVRRRFTCC